MTRRRAAPRRSRRPHRALGTGPPDLRRDPLAAAALADRRAALAPDGRRDATRDRRPRGRPLLRSALGRSDRAPHDATLRRHSPAGSRSCRSRRAARSTSRRAARDRRAPRSRRRPHGAARGRVAAAGADDADAKAMGITGSSAPTRRPTAARRAGCTMSQLVSRADRRHADRARTRFSFNGTTGERNAGKGFQEAPVIINGELQNGIGGGICQVSTTVFNAAYEAGLLDRGADEPRALHQPLPARPRRDRQLPGPRPQVQERHAPLAAAADVRRPGLADRQPLRHAAEPPRRVRAGAARRHRRGPVEADRRPHAASRASGSSRCSARRPARRASAPRLRARRHADVRQTWRRATSASRPSSASARSSARSPRAEAKPAAAARRRRSASQPPPPRRADDGDADEASAPERRPRRTTRAPASAGASPRRPSRGPSSRRDELAVPLDHVLVAEARAADVRRSGPRSAARRRSRRRGRTRGGRRSSAPRCPRSRIAL